MDIKDINDSKIKNADYHPGKEACGETIELNNMVKQDNLAVQVNFRGSRNYIFSMIIKIVLIVITLRIM
jgi:hypothetical protein